MQLRQLSFHQGCFDWPPVFSVTGERVDVLSPQVAQVFNRSCSKNHQAQLDTGRNHATTIITLPGSTTSMVFQQQKKAVEPLQGKRIQNIPK